jgi:hypothetical protein
MKNPNLLHIDTINADWCDKDEVMLHACFQLLTDCVEKEKLFTDNIDWDHSEEMRAAKKEIETLYNWWKIRQKEPVPSIDNEKGRTKYEEDNAMLIRVIKIRLYLWT